MRSSQIKHIIRDLFHLTLIPEEVVNAKMLLIFYFVPKRASQHFNQDLKHISYAFKIVKEDRSSREIPASFFNLRV